MKEVILIIGFFWAMGCKTPNESGDISSALEAEVCPQTGFGLTSSEDRQRIKSKFGDLKVLTSQCREAAKSEIESVLTQNAFVCSCVKISMDAYFFAEEESKDLKNKGDIGECLRHSSWQAHITCRWGEKVAVSLGHVREEGTESSVDSQRDEYHNLLGQKFMVRLKETKDVSGFACKENARRVAKFLWSEKLCAQINHGKKEVIKADSDHIEEKLIEFSNNHY